MKKPAADEFAAACQSECGPGGPYGALRNSHQSEGWPGRAYGAPSNAIRVQAQWPIESAAERNGASVGPEGRTER